MRNETPRSALHGDDWHNRQLAAPLAAAGAPENLAKFRELYGFMSSAVRQPKRALHAVRTLGAIAVDMYRRKTNRPVREPFAGLEKSLFSPPLLPAQAFAGDRIVVVSGSLGAGGAGRRAVNRIAGRRRPGGQAGWWSCEFLTP